jgi:hypothetical protein
MNFCEGQFRPGLMLLSGPCNLAWFVLVPVQNLPCLGNSSGILFWQARRCLTRGVKVAGEARGLDTPPYMESPLTPYMESCPDPDRSQLDKYMYPRGDQTEKHAEGRGCTEGGGVEIDGRGPAQHQHRRARFPQRSTALAPPLSSSPNLAPHLSAEALQRLREPSQENHRSLDPVRTRH